MCVGVYIYMGRERAQRERDDRKNRRAGGGGGRWLETYELGM